MTAKLDKIIKRELEIKGQLFTVAIGPEGIRVTPKGGRKGHALSWETLISGDAELYADMKISVDALKQKEQGSAGD